MQVVIDISEQDYELACKWPDALIAVYAHAIKNGTPLPKGHGRLIDANELSERIQGFIDYHKTTVNEQTNIFNRHILDGIQQSNEIVPADKEDAEHDSE